MGLSFEKFLLTTAHFFFNFVFNAFHVEFSQAPESRSASLPLAGPELILLILPILLHLTLSLVIRATETPPTLVLLISQDSLHSEVFIVVLFLKLLLLASSVVEVVLLIMSTFDSRCGRFVLLDVLYV